ncbi:unnamed protein product, partial [Rotaria sordida]
MIPSVSVPSTIQETDENGLHEKCTDKKSTNEKSSDEKSLVEKSGRTQRRKSSVINDPALREGDTNSTHNQRLASLSAAYTNILNSIGEDSMRQ